MHSGNLPVGGCVLAFTNTNTKLSFFFLRFNLPLSLSLFLAAPPFNQSSSAASPATAYSRYAVPSAPAMRIQTRRTLPIYYLYSDLTIFTGPAPDSQSHVGWFWHFGPAAMASDGIAPRGIIASSLLLVFKQADVKLPRGTKIDFGQ